MKKGFTVLLLAIVMLISSLYAWALKCDSSVSPCGLSLPSAEPLQRSKCSLDSALAIPDGVLTADEEENLSGEVIGGVRVIRIKAMRFRFEPSSIRVRLGEKVKLLVKSIDVTHGFAIEEFDIGEVLTPGSEKSIEFVPDRVGSFKFKCIVYCGPDHEHMSGALSVVR